MGCTSSTATGVRATTRAEREEEALGPPSKTMDASDYSQTLLMLVRKAVEINLGINFLGEMKAKQMITRDVRDLRNGKEMGTMYYIKVETNVQKWPWIFVKIYEPPLVTGVNPVKCKGVKKMETEYKLVTF